MVELRVLERCASFIRRVLSESSASIHESLVEEGHSLVATLDDLVTRRFDSPQLKNSMATFDRIAGREPTEDDYRSFVKFVLGDEACAVLCAIGEGGYGRLSDIRRFSKRDGTLLTNEGLQRLFSFGLLYGVPYFFLTSRGVAAYTLITGNKPVASKKDGRLFTPAPAAEMVTALRERFKQNPTLSGGAMLLLRTLYFEPLYKVSLLKNSQVVKAYFQTPKELESACQELQQRSLIGINGNGGVLLSTLGRVVAENLFGNEARPRSASEENVQKRHWIDRLIEHFETEGYRVYRRGEHPEVLGSEGQPLRFDLLLVRDRRRQGIVFPPFDDEASRRHFREMAELLMRSGQDLFVIGPGKNAVERAKVEAFDWIARTKRERVFTMTFGTIYDAFNGKLETIVVEPNRR